jgi:hypothetical protein
MSRALLVVFIFFAGIFVGLLASDKYDAKRVKAGLFVYDAAVYRLQKVQP